MAFSVDDLGKTISFGSILNSLFAVFFSLAEILKYYLESVGLSWNYGHNKWTSKDFVTWLDFAPWLQNSLIIVFGIVIHFS